MSVAAWVRTGATALAAAALLAGPAAAQPLVQISPVWSDWPAGFNEMYGASVSTAGDVNGDGLSDIIVGHPNPGGWGQYIHVYYISVGGIDNEFLVEKNQTDCQFGSSVAGAGDVNGDGYDDVLAGAPYWDTSVTDAGRVWLYYGGRTEMVERRSIALGTAQGNALFGYAVAGAGDVNGDGYDDVLIGAPLFDAGQANEGAAFLYLGTPAGIQTTSSWTLDSDQAGSEAGSSVSTAGDVNGDGFSDVLVGAPYYDGTVEDGGIVFLYLGSASGLSGEPAWSFAGDLAGMHLGLSVGTAGDVNGDGFSDIVMGAPDYSASGILPPDGRVYLFLGSSTGPAPTPDAVFSEGDRNQFGWSVATAGDTDGDGFCELAVGTRYPFRNDRADAVYLYRGSRSGLAAEPDQIIAYNKRPEDQAHTLDICVTTAGDYNGDGVSDLLVGDGFYDVFLGRALVYLGIPAGGSPSSDATWRATGPAAGARLGASLASGDWNADGWLDLLAGAPLDGGLLADAGAAFVYFGDAAGLAAQPGWEAGGGQAGEWFGHAVCDAGDVDGDGYADVAIGAPHYSNGDDDEGGVFFFAGSAGGPADTTTWSVEGGRRGSGFGYSIARAGDVNGDGYSDVVVGAFRYGDGEDEEGRAVVYYGSPYGPFEQFSWSAECDQPRAWFGFSVAGAGDVNRDGFDDVLVGAPYFDGGGGDEGAAFLYLGGETGLSDEPAAIVSIDVAGALFGYDVAGAGDVDGDGYGDILVGTGGDNLLLDEVGYAFAFAGSASGVDGTPLWSAAGGTLLGSLGRSVAGAGDVDGDGLDDILVGDPLFDNANPDAGRVLLFRGAAGAPLRNAAWVVEGDRPSAWLGSAVAPLGDIDGDGLYDVGAGAPRREGNETAAGAGAALVYGTNAGIAPVVVPGQARLDGSAIGLLAYTEDAQAFLLHVRARIPAGATRIRLQFQAGHPDQPFAYMGVESGNQVVRRTDGEDGPVFVDIVQRIVPMLSPDRAKWRVRITTDLPWLPYTRWYDHPSNPAGVASLRLGTAPDIPPPPEPPPPEPEPEPVAYKLRLDPVYPNPFNPAATVPFVLPEEGLVDVVVYDVAGERVRSLLREVRPEGPQTVTWSGRNDRGQPVASGVYWVRLVYADAALVRKMVLVR